jgi:hypothetical protein
MVRVETIGGEENMVSSGTIGRRDNMVREGASVTRIWLELEP